MKTAYELAMERLAKTSPSVKLTEAQQQQIAELESKYKARIAEREIALKDEIAQAASAGDFAKVEALEQQLVSERKKLQTELEEKKEQVRQGKQVR
jgi:molybdopterin converting factor small subunit